MAGSGIGGRRDVCLYFGDPLRLMRSAVVALSELTYLGHFGAWVDFRVRCGLPLFSPVLQ